MKKIIKEFSITFLIGLMMLCGNTVYAFAEDLIYPDKDIYKPGETVTINYDVDFSRLTSANWIGIIPANVQHGSEYVNDQNDRCWLRLRNAKGTVTLTAPSTAGTYDIRLNDNDSSGKEVSCSDTFIVTNEPVVTAESVSLNKSELDLKTGEAFSLVATVMPENATSKNIAWTSSNPEIASVDKNGKVVGQSEGEAVITATTKTGNKTATCTVKVTKSQLIINVEPERDAIYLNEEVSADVVIANISDIAAEDVRITYDSSRLQFLGMDEIDGIKIVKSQENDNELRVILASKGKNNIINSRKAVLKLKFKGIAVGEALVDITKGRISDGIEMEKDLLDTECGESTITIMDLENGNGNGDKKYTLLDLGIDGRHYGENPSDYPQYDTDVVPNGAIDDADLIQIGAYMLENPEYNF